MGHLRPHRSRGELRHFFTSATNAAVGQGDHPPAPLAGAAVRWPIGVEPRLIAKWSDNAGQASHRPPRSTSSTPAAAPHLVMQRSEHPLPKPTDSLRISTDPALRRRPKNICSRSAGRSPKRADLPLIGMAVQAWKVVEEAFAALARPPTLVLPVRVRRANGRCGDGLERSRGRCPTARLECGWPRRSCGRRCGCRTSPCWD